MFILFLVLIIGPVIVRRFINGLPSIPLDLMQPTGQDNNDTSASSTGSNVPGGAGGGGGGGSNNLASNTGFAFPTKRFF